MEISCNHNLRKQNTFGMDVSCACYVEYGSADELVMFFSEGKQFSLPRPFLHIGKGSNLLFTKDFEGTVWHKIHPPGSSCGQYSIHLQDGDSGRGSRGRNPVG